MTRGRIVVRLGAATKLRELEAAASLAGRIDAELVGLFVEDEKLLRFAALPFAREIGFASAQRRRLEVPELERAMRAHAADAERALAGTAGRIALRWSFRVARGVVAAELISAATEEIARDGVLRLFLLGDGGSPVTRWAEEARASFAQGEAVARPELVHAANLAELAAALHAGAPGIVVLRAEESVLSQYGLPDLLRQTAVPVLVLPASAA
jgi:hypothetical protein